MTRAEQEILDAIEHLRTRIVSPSLFDRFLPDGVLYDVGWNLWEHPPESGPGLAYANALRVDAGTDYAATITEEALAAGALRPDEWHALRLEHMLPDAVIDYAQFQATYNPGGVATSIAHQNALFSPEPDPTTGQPRPNPLREFLRFGEAAASAGLRSYFHLGVANNDWTFTGYLRFNADHAIEVRSRGDQPLQGERPIGAFMPTAQWHIGSDRGRFISTAQVIAATPVPFDTRMWPHFLLDPSHPEVLALCNTHVHDLVRRLRGLARGYFLRGEGTLARGRELPPGTECPERITSATFDLCAPVANFAPHAIAGFRAYMAELVGTPAALQARWGLPRRLESFAEIDLLRPPPLGQWDRAHPAVAVDYMEYLDFLWSEIGVSHYQSAKVADGDSFCGILGFSPAGLERAALHSDFAASGVYYVDIERYFGVPPERPHANGMALEADAARLHGRPLAFGLSAPPATIIVPDLPPVIWYRRCHKIITRMHMDLWLREVLTAGIAHVSYMKSWLHGLGARPSTVQAVNEGIARVRALRHRALDFMAGFQSVAVHVQRLDRIHKAEYDDEPSAVVGAALTDAMRAEQVPCAVFGSSALLQRSFARRRLRESLVIVPFHDELLARDNAPGPLFETYAELFDDGSATPGMAVLVLTARAAATLRQLQPARFAFVGRVTSVTTPDDRADVWRTVHPDGHVTRTVLFAFRDAGAGEPPAEYLRRCGALLVQELPGWRQFAAPAARPVVAFAPGANLSTNIVSDGLNYLVAVTWLRRPDVDRSTVTVAVDPAFAARFSPRFVTGFRTEFHDGSDSLRPGETLFAHVEPVLGTTLRNALDRGRLTLVVARFRRTLDALRDDAVPFAVDHGYALLDRAVAAQGRGQPARALAALVLLSRAVFVSAQRTAFATVAVRAAAIWNGAAPAVRALAGATVQVTLPRNAQDAQPRTRTDLQGRATVVVGPPFAKRWRFSHDPGFVEPTLADVEGQLEVHVTDEATGAHTFVTV